jgi:hypothetical protein
MKLKDIIFGSFSISLSAILHFPFMLMAFTLAVLSDSINDITTFNSLVWLFFWMHLTIVVVPTI